MYCLQCQCNALRKLCITEGVDEWRVDQLLRIDEYIVSEYIGSSPCSSGRNACASCVGAYERGVFMCACVLRVYAAVNTSMN